MSAKTGILPLALIWFGAAVSIAEIEAGARMGANWAALLAGHAVGAVLLFLTGLLGARSHKGSMAVTGATFGALGQRFFALLNVLQLVGWASVMLAQGASAFCSIFVSSFVAVVIGLAVLVAVWLQVNLSGRTRISLVAMVSLAGFAAFLTWKFWTALDAGTADVVPREPLAFWPAFEVSLALPISWLPLVADYTKTAARPVTASFVSSAVYSLVSLWMFGVGILLDGLGCENLAAGILKLGGAFALPGLVVIVMSTMATTFLDAFSAGESLKAIWSGLSVRLVGLAVCVLGAVLAINDVMDRYLEFLSVIAAVFAPMVTVLLVNRYWIRKGSRLLNFLAWAAGFATVCLADASPIGPTLTGMAAALVFRALCAKW